MRHIILQLNWPHDSPARSSSLAATWAACFSHMLTRVIWSGRLVLVVELDEFEAALDSAFPMIRLSCSTRTFRGAPPCGCSCGTAPLADPEIHKSLVKICLSRTTKIHFLSMAEVRLHLSMNSQLMELADCGSPVALLPRCIAGPSG